MCRVDPQAGEPGPCIVRARGAREHGKDAPPSSLLTGAFRPLAPSLMTDCAGAKSQNLSARRGNLFVWGVFDRATRGPAAQLALPRPRSRRAPARATRARNTRGPLSPEPDAKFKPQGLRPPSRSAAPPCFRGPAARAPSAAPSPRSSRRAALPTPPSRPTPQR